MNGNPKTGERNKIKASKTQEAIGAIRGGSEGKNDLGLSGRV